MNILEYTIYLPTVIQLWWTNKNNNYTYSCNWNGNIHIQKSRDLEFLNEISRPRVFKWNLETSSSEMKSRDLEF